MACVGLRAGANPCASVCQVVADQVKPAWPTPTGEADHRPPRRATGMTQRVVALRVGMLWLVFPTAWPSGGLGLLLRTAIEKSLDNRPRKILHIHSPAEVASQLTSDHIRGVALQL